MTYYLEYMGVYYYIYSIPSPYLPIVSTSAGADATSLSTLLDQSFYTAAGPVASQYAQSILQELQAIDIEQWYSPSPSTFPQTNVV